MSRLLTAEDLFALRVPSEVQMSLDGTRLAFVVTTVDRAADGYRSAIWVVDTRAGGCRPWTGGDKRDSSPRWAPDGHCLAFISNRSGTPAVWLLAAGGGEARAVGDLAGDVSEIAWAPDSRRLAVVLHEPAPAYASDVRVIERLRHRLDGAGMTYDRRRHVWLLDTELHQARQVTHGEWDDTAPTWSPDGSRIAFLSNRAPDPDRTNAVDVWTVAVEDLGAEPRRLTPTQGPCMAPAWSPDGAWVAYTGNSDPPETGVSTNHHLWLVPADGSRAPRDVSPRSDLCLGTLPLTDLQKPVPWSPVLWAPDGSRVWVIGSERGSALVYEVDLASGEHRVVVGGERHVLSASVSADGTQLGFIASTPLQPGEAFVIATNGSRERRVSQLNDALLADVRLSSPERFEARSEDGTPVEGWVMKPPDARPGVRYPAVLEIHGGPYYVLWGHTFFHELQLLAARGYVVAFANPRGSQGYGQAFSTANRGDWGGVDYQDLMATTDWLVEQPYVDRRRLGVTGGSFGGFMTNWIVSHTDRFAAAVSTRGLSNHVSAYGTSDVGYGPMDWIFYGPPWEQPELYRDRSPITHVANVRTPLLLIHNERDLRCQIEQAEQLFTALKRLGREVKLVRIPDEDHNLSRSGRPSHRLERLSWIVRWFDEHIGPLAGRQNVPSLEEKQIDQLQTVFATSGGPGGRSAPRGELEGRSPLESVLPDSGGPGGRSAPRGELEGRSPLESVLPDSGGPGGRSAPRSNQ